MSLRDENFDYYMYLLARNIWRSPFWMEEREAERRATDAVRDERDSDTGYCDGK